MNKIIVKANAKINLALFVKFKREDGFHEIESIFQEVDFGDQLMIKKSEEISFKTDSHLLREKESNLCTDAAQLLKEEYKIPGLEIELKKRIPVGAGLGGGSSDAAAVLKAGLQLYNIPVSEIELFSLAAKLGSDVPFFLSGKTAYVYGRGDGIKKVRSRMNYSVILVMPGVLISTSWAYKNLRLGLTKKECNLKLISLEFYDLKVDDFEKCFHNDFEESIFEVYPELKKIKHALFQEGAKFASLSGSGSALYGIYQSENEARSAYNKLSKLYLCEMAKPVL